MAARVGISRMTLRRLEEGDPSVGLAILLMVLDVLGLEKDIDEIARIDQIGLKALESEALGPRRSSRSEIADDL